MHTSSRNILIAFFLNLSFAIIEFIFGLLFNSSAVLADAVHDIGDALAIGLTALLEGLAQRPSSQIYSLGYKRFSLLGALLTALILIFGSLTLLIENIPNLFQAQPVNHQGMLVLGIVAIVINLLASRAVRHGHSPSESILSLHFLEDILGWLAIIIVSLILQVTDWYFLDPLLSILISLFILSKALPKCWSTVRIFLDAVPEGFDIEGLEKDIVGLGGVKSLNQLNVWSADGREHLAMIHICKEETVTHEQVQTALHQLLLSYQIQTSSIEIDSDLQDHQRHSVQ